MKITILIDYDNLSGVQKSSGLLDIVTRVLMQLPTNISVHRGSCEVRVYGGWYEASTMTQIAQDLSVSIQNDFPAIIRVPTGLGLALTVSAELAMAMTEEPSHHIFNTFRKKGKPNNVRVLTPNDVGCASSQCALGLAKRLIRTGKCPVAGCNIPNNDLVYRSEQKIVDTMLTCDLLYFSMQNYDYIMLISGDDDFLPPIRTALIRGSTIFRIHPIPNNQRIPISIVGSKLFELEL